MKANNFCWILVGLICLSQIQIAHSRRLHITESSGIKEKRQSGGYSSPGGYANVASGGYSAVKSNDSENDVDATTTVVYDETNKDEEGTSEDYQFMTTQNPSEDEAEGGYGGGSSSSEKASPGGYGSPASSPVSGGYGSPASASASRSTVSGGYDYKPNEMSNAEEDSDAEASTDKMMTEGEEMMTGRPLDQEQLENFNYPQQTSLEVPMARGGYSSPVADSGANYNTFNNYGPPPSNNYGPPARDNSNAVGGYGPAVSNNYGAPPAQQMSSYMAPLEQQGNKAAASAPVTPQNATSPAPQNYYSNSNEIVPQPTSYLPAPMMNAYRYQTMQYQPHFNGPEEVKPQVIPSIGYYLPPVQQQQQQQGRALEEPQQNIQQQQVYGPPQPQNTYRNSAPAVYSPPGAADSQNQVGQQNLAGQPRLEEQGQLQNSYAPPQPSQPEQARQQEGSSNEYGPPQPLSSPSRAPVGFQLDFEEFHDNDNVVDAELIQRVQEIIAEHERQQKELREKLRREYQATEAAFFGNGQQQQYGPPQQGFAPQSQYGAPAQPETYQAPQQQLQQQQSQQFAPAQQRDPQNQQYGPPKEEEKTLSEYAVPEQRSQPEVQYAQREQQQEYAQQQQPRQYGPPQQEQQQQYGAPKEQQRGQQYGAPKEQQNQYRQPESQYGLAPQQESGDRKPVQKYQQQPAAEYGQPEVKSAGQEEYNAPAPQQYNSPADQQDGQNSVYGPPAIQGREADFDRQNSNQADQQTNSRKAPKRYQHFELQKAILKDHFVDTLPGDQYSSAGPQFGNQQSSNYPSPADTGVPAQAYGVAGKQSEQNLPRQNYHEVHHQQQQHHLQGEQEQLRSVPQFNQQTPLAVYGSLGFSNQGNVISMPDFPLLTGYNVHPTPTAFTHSPHEQVQQQPQSHYPQPQNSYHQQQIQGQSFPTSNTQAIILQQIPTAYSTAAPTANSGNPSDFSSVQYGVPASAAAAATGSGPSAGQDVQSAGHPQQSTQTSPSSASYSAAEQDQQDQQQHSFSSPQSYNQQLDQFVNPTYAPLQPREEGQHQQQQIGYVFPQTSSFIPQSAYGAGPESLTTLNEIPTSSPKPVYGIPLAPALGPEAFAQSSPSAPSPTAPTTAFDQPRFAPQPQHQMYEPVTFSQAQFAYQQQPSPSYGVSPFSQQQNQLHHQQLALSSPSAPSYPQASSELEQQQQSLWSAQTASAESNQGQHNSDQDGHLNSITVPSQAYGLRTVPDVLNVNNNNNLASHNQLYESSSPSGHQAQGGYSRFPRRSRKVVRKNVRRSTTTTTEKTA